MRKFVLFLNTLLIAATASAQQISKEQVLDGFARMYANSLHEKVYVMTDKPYYSAGERIWLRGWVVDAVSHTGQTPTNYLYVDMLDASDNLVQRIKIKRDSTGFNNAIDLPSDMKAGSYALVAYTQWQTNWSQDLFFRRRIEIGNTIDDVVMHDVSYVLGEDSTATALVNFYGFDGPYANYRVLCSEVRDDKRDRNFTLRTDINGQIQIEYTPIEGVVGTINMTLEVPNRSYEASLLLPELNNSIHVAFMPEGGGLLANTTQRVAFKVIGADGYGRDVEGAIYDETGAVICPIASTYLGMGTFEMTPRAGAKYYAEVERNGHKFRFSLPEVQEYGCALAVEKSDKGWQCRLLATPDFDRSNLSALVHSRGALVYMTDTIADGFVIPEDVLLEGVSQVAVFDNTTYDILSERLIFRHPSEQFTTELKTATPVNYKRQKVTLDIKIANHSAEAINGDFAATITDKRMVRRSSSDENIVSSLLLSSELGGYIENPSAYLGEAREHTDLLMMTQGWRRFDIGEVVRDSITLPTVGFEQTQVIEGRISNAFNREPKGAQLVVHNSTTGTIEHFTLGNERNGKFRLEGLVFPDSTIFTFSALNRNGQNMVLGVALNEPRLPITYADIFPRLNEGKIERYIPEEYLNTNKEKYYQEGGMRVIDIEEIVVTTRPLESSRFKGVIPTHVVFAEKYAKHYHTALDLATKIPGIRMEGNRIGQMVSSGRAITMNAILAGAPLSALNPRRLMPPFIFVDDMPTPMSELEQIPSEDVISVSYFPASRAGIYGPNQMQRGVLYFKLVPNHLRKHRKDPSISAIRPLGFKQAVEFYQPKYDVPNQPDLRTTVAWVPAVQFDDEGRATIEFYTTDRATDYDVVIEGITDDGRPCSVQAVVERSEKAR